MQMSIKKSTSCWKLYRKKKRAFWACFNNNSNKKNIREKKNSTDNKNIADHNNNKNTQRKKYK